MPMAPRLRDAGSGDEAPIFRRASWRIRDARQHRYQQGRVFCGAPGSGALLQEHRGAVAYSQTFVGGHALWCFRR